MMHTPFRSIQFRVFSVFTGSRGHPDDLISGHLHDGKRNPLAVSPYPSRSPDPADHGCARSLPGFSSSGHVTVSGNIAYAAFCP